LEIIALIAKVVMEIIKRYFYFIFKKGILHMKKLIALLLLVVLSFSMPVWAVAQYGEQSNGPALYPTSIDGYIENETENTIEVVSQDGQNRVILNITPETYLVDAETGLPLALTNRNGDRIIAYYGPVMTFSEPPQSNAVLILGNIQEGTIPPQFGQVEAIEVSDDQVVVTIRGGSLLVTIRRDSRIEPFRTRNIVTVDNINVGSRLLMWVPMETLSYPGQATAQRTILLNHGPEQASDIEYRGYENGYNGYENGYNDYQPAELYEPYVNGYEPVQPIYEQPIFHMTPVTPQLPDVLRQFETDFYVANNVTMVPLRLVAESLGFTVTWNEADRSVALQYAGGQVSTLVIGQTAFAGSVLETAPIIRNDRTFVPVSFFDVLHNEFNISA